MAVEKQPSRPADDAFKPDPKAKVFFRGSCSCGRITYDSTQLPDDGDVTICHCIDCRKISGGPFQVFVGVKAKSVYFYDIKEHLRYEGLPKDNMGGIEYVRLSRAGERAFCIDCHTSLGMRYKSNPGGFGVTLGTVDEGSVVDEETKKALKPNKHIFVCQKVWWLNLPADGLPRYERHRGSYEEQIKAWEAKAE